MSEKKVLNEITLSEKEKALAGLPYSPLTSEELINDLFKAREILHKYNNSKPARINTDECNERRDMIKQLFGSVGKDFVVEPPFYCDYVSFTILNHL
jgi:maltose O-acetyltransferase